MEYFSFNYSMCSADDWISVPQGTDVLGQQRRQIVSAGEVAAAEAPQGGRYLRMSCKVGISREVSMNNDSSNRRL